MDSVQELPDLTSELAGLDVDDVTLSWVRNRSDVLAVKNGCRFDEARGQSVVDWVQQYCRLYEGSNDPVILGDWQYEATMRMFGWQRWSERLGRWIRRFTRVSIYIAKKSAKTPTAACWALYLLAGDGEKGNHIFFAASDGGQARIAAKHAVEMVRASPDLDAEQGGEIAINMAEMKLTHIPSRSDAKPISSNDKRAAKAKQGLNGSVIIDETHVVTPEFIAESSIKRAGESRDEPLHIEVSTAGRDPDSYGRKQYDYGKQVEAGDVEDQGFFFLCYEAPQNLTEAQLAADPVKWGKIANPTWGRIIQEDRYLADYNESKRSIADIRNFMTDRLNVWQQAASPWLRKNDWDKCCVKFTEEDMRGRECVAGLDLSKIWDTTAIVLCFPMDDGLRYRLLPFFFLPKAGLDRIARTVPQFLDWAANGFIRVTGGDVMAFPEIRKFYAELAGTFSIMKLIYDPNQAENVTQEMYEDTGTPREAFTQSTNNFASPTDDFERLVIAGEMEHNGHPLLSWQMGHVNVETNANNYKRPVKPGTDDVKKIDGAVAGIMALAAAQQIRGWSPEMGM